MMYAVKGMEVREVKRERRGLRWCPWCDTSVPDHFGNCPKCHAEFTDNPTITSSMKSDFIFTKIQVAREAPTKGSVVQPPVQPLKARKRGRKGKGK